MNRYGFYTDINSEDRQAYQPALVNLPVIHFTEDDSTHPAHRILRVTLPARDEMKMAMQNGLPRRRI